MPRKPKKALLLVLVLMMVTLLLAACGGSSSPSESQPTPQPQTQTPAPDTTTPAVDYGDTGGIQLPIVTEPVELTWMLVSDTENLNDKFIVQEIEKRTGIKINFQPYSSATFKEKLQSILASNKLPDLFHGLTVAEANEMGLEGALEPINPHLDQLPNFKKLYQEEEPWVMKSYSAEDGTMFTWPIYDLNREVNHGFMYRKDIFDKHGIAEWTNTEEFYQALKKLKELYPNSYPYASKTKETIFIDWGYGWGVSGNAFPMKFDHEANNWYLASTSDEYRDMLDFMKKLYQEKLLDPEFLTDTQDSWTAKMTANDQGFVTFDWIGRLDLFYNQVSAENPDYNLRYANPVGPTGNVRSLPKVSNFALVVTKSDKSEIALKLLDYLSSPSGAELITMGVEGEQFTLNAEGKPEYPELKDVPLVDIKVLENNYGLWLEGMYLRTDRRSVYYNFTEKEQEAQDKIVSGNKFEPIDTLLKFTDDENSTIAEWQSTLLKATNEFSAQYIFNADSGDKEWEDWKADAAKLESENLVEIYNNAQKRFDTGN